MRLSAGSLPLSRACRRLRASVSVRWSSSSSVYCWGDASTSSLPGVPSTSSSVSSPRAVNLEEVKEAHGVAPDYELKFVSVGKSSSTALVFSSPEEGKADLAALYGSNKYVGSGRLSVEAGPLVGIDQLVVGESSAAVTGVDESGDRLSLSWGFPGSALNGFGQLALGAKMSDEGKDFVELPAVVSSLVEDETPLDEIGIGQSHIVGLCTATNEVLTAGSGQYGRLGNVDSVDQLYFEPVEYLTTIAGASYAQVSVGGAFTLVRTEDGRVFSWGKNDKGQLGLGGGLSMDVYAMESMPNLIDEFSDSNINVVHVSAGKNHAAAVGEEGGLYVWGGKSNFLSPELITDLPEEAAWCGCGENFTIIKGRSGSVYSMSHGGSGGGVKVGCLGRGVVKGDRKPQLLASLEEDVTGGKVKDIVVGWKHVAVTVEK